MRKTVSILAILVILTVIGCGGGGGGEQPTGSLAWVGTWELTEIQVLEDTGTPHRWETGVYLYHDTTGQVDADGSEATKEEFEQDASDGLGYDVTVTQWENSCDGDTQITNATMEWTDQYDTKRKVVITTVGVLASDTLYYNDHRWEWTADGHTYNIDHIYATFEKISDEFIE